MWQLVVRRRCRRSPAGGGVALAVLLALAPAAWAQESPCDAIYELGTRWDELAVALDEALDGGLAEDDVAAFEERIAEYLAPSRELVDVLLDAPEDEVAELGALLEEDLDYLEESTDYEMTLEDIDYVVETLDVIVEVCDESVLAAEEDEGAVPVA